MGTGAPPSLSLDRLASDSVVFDPTPVGPWVGVWLTPMTTGSEGVLLDGEVREELRALGYVGS
jgi:hypothetical protein